MAGSGGSGNKNYETNYTRIQKFRSKNGISRGRNIAFADYNINGESGTQFATSSGDFPGTVPTPANRLFNVIDTGIGNPYKDSENKLLEWLGSKYESNPDVEGIVDLYTERRPCLSCDAVIDQFSEMFPNIIVNVTYGPFDTVWTGY